jgi:hypothetical protein
MARTNLTEGRKQDFLKRLRDLGGRSGNKALTTALGWDDEFYSRVQAQLISEGKIRSGPGRGGSVAIVEESIVSITAPLQPIPISAVVPEQDLYSPIRKQIEAKWIATRGYDTFIIEETHSQGSRATGGTYSRPDITVVGVKKYLFLPTVLEAVTFEIKPRSAVNVVGVLEALSHRESVNKSYVAFHIGADAFDHSDEASRIVALSQRHGVGLILVEDQNNYDTWDIRSEAQWTSPDPDRLDAFINGLREEPNKEKLRRALR